MDKQSEGLILLKDIRHISRQIEELQEEIDKVYALLTSTTIKPKEVDVQSSGAPDPMADKIIQMLEYQSELERQQTELFSKKNIVIKIIYQMDIQNQQILLLRYFKGMSVEEMGEQIGYTYRWAWEKLHQAEEEFISLYEKTT